MKSINGAPVLLLQVSNVISLMASPYPKHGLVEVVNQTAQVIDKDGAPVPLSDVRTLPFTKLWPGCALRAACLTCP